MAKQKLDLNSLILSLLDTRKTISLKEIAIAAGLSESPADRRAIQRAIKKLILQDVVEIQGKARARVYSLKNDATDISFTLNSIFTSKHANALIQYFSQPSRTRKAIGYQPLFLKSYQPNKTFYLHSSLLDKLHRMGKAESIDRPAGTYARNIFNRLLIDLSWNSSRLEGNTYSLLETKRLIEHGENALGKDATEAQMILNHKEAIEYIIDSAHDKKISSHQICSIHALLSDNLLGDPGASGRLRNIAVGISGTSYLPLDNPHLLKEYFDIFIMKLNQIQDPFEQSFFSLIQLSYLQAFEDVNKRTARLVANIPLIKHNLKPLSFVDVNQQEYLLSLLGIYEKNDLSLFQDLYLWAYERSSQQYTAIQQSMGEPNVFKLKYRHHIQEIIRSVILNNISGPRILSGIQESINKLRLSNEDAKQLLKIIENEIINLHEGNIARFKVRPSEFKKWKQ